MTYKGQPEGKVGTNLEQLEDCEPETPPSPEAKRMEVPRAPSWAYALHSWLHRRRSVNSALRVAHADVLGKLGGDRVLILAVAGREHLRGRALIEEEVDDVEEALEVAVLEVVANGDEDGRDGRGEADGVLDVQVLCQAVSACLCTAA